MKPYRSGVNHANNSSWVVEKYHLAEIDGLTVGIVCLARCLASNDDTLLTVEVIQTDCG